MLFQHLHANNVAYRPYTMFDYYIVQQQREGDGGSGGGDGDGDSGGERGGGNGCDARTRAEFDTACVILGAAGLLPTGYSRFVPRACCTPYPILISSSLTPPHVTP